MMDWWNVRAVILFLLPALVYSQTTQRRCYVCRSRGERGDCRDPFIPPEARIPGLPVPAHSNPITELPCSSGWCSKVLDGNDKNTIENFDLATDRGCLARGPSDGQERCGNVFVEEQHREVYMCMCKGDLCNSARTLQVATTILTSILIALLTL
eukprot:TRINITY_DN1190_c0_g1_i1.p1 TRINITY_DN1190_c0_g1~~TRINITY_DN1190_c0_g1_i1.p1  ORF type:complete len:154 (+),score=28.89 TRINITY_DN1190_c0_g1_i1:99-560(+)